MASTDADAKISVTPEVFAFISYDSNEIADVLRDVAARLDIANPIRLEVDETTPLGKMSARLLDGDGTVISGPASSDATLGVRDESGALEDTTRFTNVTRRRASISHGRIQLRARVRLRADYADVAPDEQLSLSENAAWDAYCAGRLDRAGFEPNKQRFRYNFRNRFGFSDAVDAIFDELWDADDLGWDDLPRAS